MEALSTFFKEVSDMTCEYSKKEKCEIFSFVDKMKSETSVIELLDKIKKGVTLQENDIDHLSNKLNLEVPKSLIKAFEDVNTEDPFSVFMLSDISIEVENKCISLLRNKLFSLSSNDRNIYASMLAREFDSKLFCEFDAIDYIYEKGYETHLLENSITAFMDAVIESFAEFNIDLVEYLKKDSDFEKKFGDYNDFRARKYINRTDNTPSSTKEIGSNTGKETPDSDIKTISSYLNVKDKNTWLAQAHSSDNYQVLANFLAKETALGSIASIPSKKGGGLFNLACIEFPKILNYTNEKERRVLRNAVNNAVKKYKDYNDIYPQK